MGVVFEEITAYDVNGKEQSVVGNLVAVYQNFYLVHLRPRRRANDDDDQDG